jgi:hypothetical protein
VWYFNSSYAQYGDEILLGTNITSHVLTQLQIEYYGDFTPTGDEQAEVRLYKNDGPRTQSNIPTPGTLLYDSGKFNISTNYETWTSTFLDVTLPDDVTWTIQFYGMSGSAGDRAGILFQDPPTVGRSYNDAWLLTSSWQTVVFQSEKANFAARFSSDPLFVSIKTSGNNVVVEWTGAAILQVADQLDGNWTDLPDYRNKYTFSTQKAPMKFWRLRD